MRIRWIVGIAALALLAACGQVAAPDAPAAPTSLMATASSSSSVDLDWTASATADVTYRVYRSSSSPVEVTAANRLATGLTTTAYMDSTVVAGTTYYYVVTALSTAGESEASNEVSVTPSGTTAACAPYSTLACSDVFVATATAFTLDWAGSEGGIADTGFTMVLPSENYDGTDADADALTESLLNVASGNLTITTLAGIKAGTNNDQANALGVGFDATSAHTVSTTIVNPGWATATNDFQQAGVWFGLDDDNYVKLVVVNEGATSDVTVQLYYEFGGVADPGPGIVESAPFDATASTVELILTLDPGATTVSGSYSIDGAAAVPLASSVPVDASLFNGTATSFGTMSFAGVFATHRFGSEIDVSFTDFALAQP